MAVVADTVGALLIGTWTNSALWAIEMVLLYQYACIFGTKDNLLIRASIVVCSISDFACTIINMVSVYGVRVLLFLLPLKPKLKLKP
ncbi:hypothetical protein BT69DRAFT_1353730 [Atractiella rhizophila]|nr:hypothetical protein BT69DRAFT_1353730 [Atractiella rhizophila]